MGLEKEERLKSARIGVLMGGVSSEREISLKSGRAVSGALKEENFAVEDIDIRSEEPESVAELLKSQQINCAFIALHGRFGEDGTIQRLLEELGLPYTGSGVSASRLAMDKILSREIFVKGGLRVPRSLALDKKSYKENGINYRKLGLPLVVKPATGGSSIGLSIVDEEPGIKGAIEEAFDFDDRILIEEYVRGREMTVGILEDQALPVIEIIPKKKFFDFQAKYTSGMTEYMVPAGISFDESVRLQQAAFSAHRLLGCYGCSRVDLILDGDGAPCVLEVNTIPGMTATSLLPKAAKTMGITFNQLCVTLIRLAYEPRNFSGVQA